MLLLSENEGSDLGIPWPDRPPSSDCPVGWHADDAPWRHRVRGRGSRPVLAQNQGVRVPIPAGFFYAPKNTPQGFSVAKNTDFVRKTWGVRVPIPAGAFYAPQNTPQGFSRGKSSVLRNVRRNTRLAHARQSAGST